MSEPIAPASAAQSVGADAPLIYGDGATLRAMTSAAYAWLDHHRDIVNALNVFPVPDGDTGTNMVLTMRSATRRIAADAASADAASADHAGKVAHAISRGALMGARGNSGVILSQIWAGFADALQDTATFDAATLAGAFRAASDKAYKGVMEPVEGTILTVIREIATAAEEAVEADLDWPAVLQYALDHARRVLQRTPEMLPVLKEAGVVDSGGQGLVYLLEGMVRWLHGEMDSHIAAPAADGVADHVPAQALAQPAGGQLENPYDVQFILLGRGLDVLQVRADIDAMGDSTVVVGDETTIKVHVHVKDPGVPISYGVARGQITDVVVENMQEQMETIIAAGGIAPVAPAPVAPPAIEAGQIGVVTVAAGDGLAEVFRSLGVAEVVAGGQTNNPSTEEILHAVEALPTDRVIVLPNNKNIILAAEQARDLSEKQVAVVPSRTVPQGLTALLSLDVNGELDAVAAAMTAALADVITVEFTTATRTVTLDGVDVAEGQRIAIVDGRLAAAGATVDDILEAALADAAEDAELVSIYYGADVDEASAAALGDQIMTLFPDIETELLSGGQAYYDFILGIE